MITNIKATNRIGQSVSLEDDIRLINGIDLSGLDVNVVFFDSNLGGGIYQNSILKNRQLPIEMQIRRKENNDAQMENKRIELNRVFSPNLGPVTISFTNSNGVDMYIQGYSEFLPIMKPDKSNDNAAFQRVFVELLCTDPYIYEYDSTHVDITSYSKNFSFPINIPSTGMEFGTRDNSNTTFVYLDTDTESGMEIEIEFFGYTVNPYIFNRTTNRIMRVSEVFDTGDILRINTTPKQKGIVLTRNGVNTNYMRFLRPDSLFPTLVPGDNEIAFGALDGQGYMTVVFDFKKRHLGV